MLLEPCLRGASGTLYAGEILPLDSESLGDAAGVYAVLRMVGLGGAYEIVSLGEADNVRATLAEPCNRREQAAQGATHVLVIGPCGEFAERLAILEDVLAAPRSVQRHWPCSDGAPQRPGA